MRQQMEQTTGLLVPFVVTCHGTRYNTGMIKTFADKHTEELFLDGNSSVLPPDVRKRALRKLDRVDTAYRVDDLRVPPGNRLHKLQGDREGQWSLSINDQWRICFRFEGEDAYDVEICDYH